MWKKDQGKDLKIEEVVGTWVQELSDGTETITFNPDMTYHKAITLTSDSPLSMETDDTFSIKGNKISINYSSYNTVSDYTVEIKGDIMIWDSGEGKMEYKRK